MPCFRYSGSTKRDPRSKSSFSSSKTESLIIPATWPETLAERPPHAWNSERISSGVFGIIWSDSDAIPWAIISASSSVKPDVN